MALGRAGSDVEFPAEDDSVPAYRAVPPVGSGRGVLVLHEAWGLAEQIRDVCDRLAREGFVALAPDLFRGRLADRDDDAQELMAGLETARVGADIDGAVRALMNDHRVDGGRVGVLGFCMGGALALFAATRSPRIGAVVDCYGVSSDTPLDFSTLKAPVLGIFGTHDELVTRDDVQKLEVSLRAAGKRVAIKMATGAGHGFMNESRPERYDARAAAECWDVLLSFLRAEL